MANERVSPTQRVRMQNVAEREVMRYAGDHARWHKHVHNVELDAMQLLKMEEMDRYAQTIDNSCRRTGKTTTKELWCLEYLATHDRKSTRLNSSHYCAPRMPSSACK